MIYDELTAPVPGFTVGSNSKWTTLTDNAFFSSAPQGILTRYICTYYIIIHVDIAIYFFDFYFSSSSHLLLFRTCSSVLNWSKSASEIPVSLLGTYAATKDAVATNETSEMRNIFEIDGEEMFIPNSQVDSEYFVVL